jgi:hypothetical protein
MENSKMFRRCQFFGSPPAKLKKGLGITRRRGYWVYRGHGFSYLDPEIIGTRNHIQPMRRTESSFITTTFAPVYSFPKWSREKTHLLEIANSLESCFNDAVQRQITFSNLKNSISQLKETVGLENRGFLRVINMSYDALQNTKSEKLKKTQVKQLKYIISKFNENINDFTATELEGILIDSGLSPTPKVEGIANLYE